VIDRKTTLASAALIALMLVAAAWRIYMLNDATSLPIENETPLPPLLLFFFPACRALVVGALYWESLGARADDTKIRPFRKWAKSLAIRYCGGMVLLEGVVIVRSLSIDTAFDLSVACRSLGVLLAIMCLLAINQMPKLPWFERRVAPGGDLGPIYGPRHMRTQSKIKVVFMIAVISYSLAAPQPLAWHSTPYILLAAALLVCWSIIWRIQLGRKWKLERRAVRG